MPEASQVLPVIKPHNWLGREYALCRPMVLPEDLPDSPLVGFGYDLKNNFEVITRENFPSDHLSDSLRMIEQAAMRNLRERPVHWKIEVVKLGPFWNMRLLVCGEDNLACERILDEKFLQEAQSELRAQKIAVGIPYRGLLVAANASSQDDTLARFSAMVSAQYHQPLSAALSPQVFLVQDGKIVGIVTGQEKAGRKLAGTESRGGSQVYINASVTTDQTTGGEKLQILAGSPDFEQLVEALQTAFTRNLEQMLEHPDFSGSIQIVLVNEITSPGSALELNRATLLEFYQSYIASAGIKTLKGKPVEVSVMYGAPDEALHPSDPTLKSLLQLIANLTNAQPAKRKEAAEEIGNLLENQDILPAGHPLAKRFVRALVRSLGDPNIQVRSLAAEALERMGEMAVQPLREMLSKGTHPEGREYAILALSGLDGWRSTDLFLMGLQDPDPGVRRRCAGALVNLCGPGETFEQGSPLYRPLVDALKDPDPSVRSLAASGLGRLGDRRAVEPLIEALSDPEEEVKGKAAHSLGELKDPRATPHLVHMLKTQHIPAQLFSIWALGELRDPLAASALVQTLLDALDHKNEALHQAAAAAIHKLGRTAIAPLQKARSRLDHKKDSEVDHILAAILTELRKNALFSLFKKRGRTRHNL
jgi:HEAT repeat protein